MTNDYDIAENFAKIFEAACTPNSTQYYESMKKVFKDQFANYVGDSVSPGQLYASAESVALAVCKLNKGKAPGCDGIMLEHVLHCHPIIYTILGKLFNRMIITGYVPVQFGQGIMIPIPKGDKTCSEYDIGNFRGITISPLISKIFEHCLMELMQDYLVQIIISLVLNQNLVALMLYMQ